MAYKPVGADENGNFPPRVEAKISAGIGERITAALAAEGFIPGEVNSQDEFTVSFDDSAAPFIQANETLGIHDTLIDGMLLELLPDGSEYVQAVSERDPATGETRLIWGKRLDGTEYPGGGDVTGAVTTYKAEGESAQSIVSGPAISLCGHSMAAGMFTELQAALPGVTLINNTVGGETSRTIAWRQGGQPLTLLPSGGAIPASGPVTVTLRYADGPPVLNGDWPMIQGATSYPGFMVIDGQKVLGTFSITRSPSAIAATHHVDDTYQFTRSTAGTSITAIRPAPFYTTASEAQRGNIFVYWMGRNNYTEKDQVMADLQAMIQHQVGLEKRFLVISEQAGEYSTEYTGTSGALALRALNLEYRKLSGRRYINSFDYLITYGLQDAGITATAGDTTDIANGIIPRSLRTDSLHLTNAADTIMAALTKLRLKETGWIL